MVALSPLGGAGWQFFDNNGIPLAGGKLYTYAAGTTTPAVTYTTNTGAPGTENSNPIILDSAGRVPSEIWLVSAAAYKFRMDTATGVTLWTKDNVPGIYADATVAASDVAYNQGSTGAVDRTVQSRLQDYVSVKDFGAVGDGVADDTAAIQAAINAASVVNFTEGETYLFGSTVTIASSVKLITSGATIKASGANSTFDLFSVSSAIDIEVEGGTFQDARRAIGFASAAGNITVKDATFSNMGHAIAVNTSGVSITSSGALRVGNCNFSDMEIGITIQSSRFTFVDVNGCKFTDLKEKTLASRPYPFDKKIVSGLWYQSLTGDCAAIVRGNYVDGVVGFAAPPAEPEVHGLAVTLDDASQTDVIIEANVVKNVNGSASIEGDEGIMGRGRRVVIMANTLKDAGTREGSIYAKGSSYHKISGNIIEFTGTPASTSRGVISTGSNCDVTDNKFINTPTGIYSRALQSIYRNNEFISCGTGCIILALETGAIHVSTVVENNNADENCAIFFSDTTTGTEVHGAFIFRGNSLFNGGRAVSLKGATNVVFEGNYVNRVNPNSSREVLIFTAPTSAIFINRNEFVNFDSAASDGRVLTGSTTNTPRIFCYGNYFGSGSTALWMRDQTYVDYIIRDNQFFSTNKINGTIGVNVTVSGIGSVANNVGIDIT